MAVVNSSSSFELSNDFLEEYRSDNIVLRWTVILKELNQFFDYAENNVGDLVGISELRLKQLRVRSLWRKIKQKIKR